jgi:hypothetical protein
MIVALPFYDGDLEQTMSLARLLADIEPVPRDDVVLALVHQPDTKIDELVRRTVDHCRLKFTVDLVASPLGGQGHPSGCTALWAGTVTHYFERWKRGDLWRGLPRVHDCILTLDGGDGVPLHPDWIDLFRSQHWQTVQKGMAITGSPYYLGGCPLHVNPNAIFELSIFEKTKLITDIPRHDGTLATHFDIYHREEMLAHSELSSVVRTDWRGDGQKMTPDLMRELARRAIWLHGYKDPDLSWIARKHLAASPVPLEIEHYDLANLRRHEQARRCLEAFRRNPC